MKAHTQTYKENLVKLGKEIEAKVIYTINGVQTELDGDTLGSVTPHYEGAILKSVMKQVDIVSDIDIPLNTEINVQFGLKFEDENYEYVDYGNYIVFSSEKQEDTNNYKIIAYDKILYAMKDYEELEITYPITIRNYLIALCTKLGLEFANSNDTFTNYDKQIKLDLYKDLGYTYRDILDELAQVTASTICINEDDELEVRYINDTDTNEFEIIGSTTQDGTPTPTNPIPIVNKTGIIEEEINGVIRTLNIKDIWLGAINDYKDRIFKGKGINLFDKDNLINDVFIHLTNGSDTTNANWKQSQFIKVKPSTTYIISNSISMAGSGYFEVSKYNSSQTWVSSAQTGTSGNKTQTFTTDSTTEYIKLGVYKLGTNTDNVMLNEGSTALPYEPYNSKDKWLLHKEIGKVVLNGSETIEQQSTSSGNYRFAVSGPNDMKTNNELNVPAGLIKSNRFIEISNATSYVGNSNGMLVRANNTKQFMINCMETITYTTAQFKTWLGNNNILVYYVLNTPTTIEITDKDIIKSLNDTGLDIIDEDYIKNTRADFGEKYGPINSIVLSRSADTDNVYLQDQESIEENGLCEIKIKDNQILNDNDRSDFLPGLLEQLDGIEYYINNFESIGITYLDLCDKYNVKIEDKFYNCIMFNNEVEIGDGLNEIIYTDKPEITQTDYKRASKTDKTNRQTYLIIDKQQGQINSLISRVVDVSNTITGGDSITLENAHEGQLHYLSIKGVISQLFASNTTYPNDTRIIIGPTLVIDEDEYTLDIDKLRYINNTICDEFVYKDGECYIIRRVDSNNNPLAEEVIEERQSIVLNVKSNSTIYLKTFNNIILNCEYLLENVYTENFASQVEVKSEIIQTENSIEQKVSAVADSNGNITSGSILLAINNDESQATINADKISLEGKTINMTSDNIKINSTNFNVDEEGNLTCNNANMNGTITSSNGNIGGWVVNGQGLTNGAVHINSDGSSTIYTVADLIIMRGYIMGTPGFELGGSALRHYDLNGDGQVTTMDYIMLKNLIGLSMDD